MTFQQYFTAAKSAVYAANKSAACAAAEAAAHDAHAAAWTAKQVFEKTEYSYE